MAQWRSAVVRRGQCFAVPEGLNDEVAAALPNPGVSAWLTMKERAKLAPGEAVLILGATGVTGKLAVQTAKILGASRVIAAGRNEKALNSLLELGADATIQIDKSAEELTKVFAREAGDKGFQIVITICGDHPRRHYSPLLHAMNLLPLDRILGSFKSANRQAPPSRSPPRCCEARR